jgi:hypothetical protein
VGLMVKSRWICRCFVGFDVEIMGDLQVWRRSKGLMALQR